MKDYILPILILLVFIWTILPSSSDANDEQLFQFDHVKNEGYVAFIVNEYNPETPDEEVEDLCDGSGYITHGDGHKTPCPGCKNCQSGQETAENLKKKLNSNQPSRLRPLLTPELAAFTLRPVPQTTEEPQKPQDLGGFSDGEQDVDKQILYFSANWCGPCNSFKSREVPKLKSMGIKVTESKDADVRIVDVDKKENSFLKVYKSSKVVPEFVLIKNKKLIKFMTGYQSASTIARWHNES